MAKKKTSTVTEVPKVMPFGPIGEEVTMVTIYDKEDNEHVFPEKSANDLVCNTDAYFAEPSWIRNAIVEEGVDGE